MDLTAATGTIYTITLHCGIEGRRVRFSLQAPIFSDDGETIDGVAGSWCSMKQHCSALQRSCRHATGDHTGHSPLLPAPEFPAAVSFLGPAELIVRDSAG